MINSPSLPSLCLYSKVLISGRNLLISFTIPPSESLSLITPFVSSFLYSSLTSFSGYLSIAKYLLRFLSSLSAFALIKSMSSLISLIPAPTSARYSSLSSSLSNTSFTYSFLFERNLVQLRYKKPNWAILDSLPSFIRLFK